MEEAVQRQAEVQRQVDAQRQAASLLEIKVEQKVPETSTPVSTALSLSLTPSDTPEQSKSEQHEINLTPRAAVTSAATTEHKSVAVEAKPAEEKSAAPSPQQIRIARIAELRETISQHTHFINKNWFMRLTPKKRVAALQHYEFSSYARGKILLQQHPGKQREYLNKMTKGWGLYTRPRKHFLNSLSSEHLGELLHNFSKDVDPQGNIKPKSLAYIEKLFGEVSVATQKSEALSYLIKNGKADLAAKLLSRAGTGHQLAILNYMELDDIRTLAQHLTENRNGYSKIIFMAAMALLNLIAAATAPLTLAGLVNILPGIVGFICIPWFIVFNDNNLTILNNFSFMQNLTEEQRLALFLGLPEDLQSSYLADTRLRDNYAVLYYVAAGINDPKNAVTLLQATAAKQSCLGKVWNSNRIEQMLAALVKQAVLDNKPKVIQALLEHFKNDKSKQAIIIREILPYSTNSNFPHFATAQQLQQEFFSVLDPKQRIVFLNQLKNNATWPEYFELNQKAVLILSWAKNNINHAADIFQVQTKNPYLRNERTLLMLIAQRDIAIAAEIIALNKRPSLFKNLKHDFLKRGAQGQEIIAAVLNYLTEHHADFVKRYNLEEIALTFTPPENSNHNISSDLTTPLLLSLQ